MVDPNSQLRYRSLTAHLKARYGTKVARITLRGGFTCPNRDGTRGRGGCTFCSGSAMGASHVRTNDIAEQLAVGMRRVSRRYRADRFVAYFNDYSATYAPTDRLAKLYGAALKPDDVVGLAIGTRPDCLPPDVLDLLSEFNEKTDLWVELGLQTAHQDRLDAINRCHTVEEFAQAVLALAKRDIAVCAHVILGLPGETCQRDMETAEFLSRLPIAGIKIHNFHVLRGSKMEQAWNRGEMEQPPSLDEHVRRTRLFLERIPAQVVILRVAGDAPKHALIAPNWCLDKQAFLRALTRHMAEQDSSQGKFLGARRADLVKRLDGFRPSDHETHQDND
ncbi:MAG: TIGR01212 family radical SAM protein [Deltaproteobacteria bacterium]|nr:TIGR01212 family radical SAM protein [Deltaproteobacteria bacterium]